MERKAKMTEPELPDELLSEKHVLSNGLEVVICRRPGLHRVCLLLNVASGCRNEDKPGTAHMLEHLMFRGTKAHPGLRAVSEAFEACGADFNAYTAREVTSYDISTPAQSLEEVLVLLGEVISGPKLSGISAERNIIREEILADYDADGSLINVDDLLVSRFYGEAGHPIAGDPEDLAQITRGDVQAYYETHYAAENMLLVMAGPIGATEELLDCLERAFEGVRRGVGPGRCRKMPDEYVSYLENGKSVSTRLCIKKYDGATQSEALLGFLSGPPSGGDFPALEMLVRVLDDGMASRLSRRLVEELALVYDAEAFLSTTQESTLLQIRVTCRHRRVGRVMEAVYEILREIAEKGVDASELERLRRRVVWEHQGMLDGVAQLAQWVSTMKLQHLPCDVRERSRVLLAVSADDIRRMSRRVLSELPHIVAIVGDIGERGGEEIQSVMQTGLGRDVRLETE